MEAIKRGDMGRLRREGERRQSDGEIWGDAAHTFELITQRERPDPFEALNGHRETVACMFFG